MYVCTGAARQAISDDVLALAEARRRGADEAVLASTIFPLNGAYRSETLFGDSTSPKGSPDSVSPPTSGSCTNTMSPVSYTHLTLPTKRIV